MQFLRQHRALISLLAPLVVFFALGSLINVRTPATDVSPAGTDGNAFLTLVISRTVLMLAIIAICWRTYTSTAEGSGGFRFQVDHRGVLTGVIGAAAWILLCELGLEARLMSLIGMGGGLGGREGVNPFTTYADGGLWTFLAFRFALLVVAVPIAEELFLRGFFMRAIDATNWQDMPLRDISMTGLAAGTIYGVVSHPSEFIAAAVWFSLVTLLMVRTDKFWNCVVAHAITNLILGVYICLAGSWYLW